MCASEGIELLLFLLLLLLFLKMMGAPPCAIIEINAFLLLTAISPISDRGKYLHFFFFSSCTCGKVMQPTSLSEYGKKIAAAAEVSRYFACCGVGGYLMAAAAAAVAAVCRGGGGGGGRRAAGALHVGIEYRGGEVWDLTM